MPIATPWLKMPLVSVSIDGAAFGEWIHVLLALCLCYSSSARPAAVPATLRNLLEPFGLVCGSLSAFEVLLIEVFCGLSTLFFSTKRRNSSQLSLVYLGAG